ncbi:MAG: hypothetical protein VSS52_009585, partial [Thiotrichaceae bacterium]|nr:hypothetical protein [Thiotrichaceae bacterium]
VVDSDAGLQHKLSILLGYAMANISWHRLFGLTITDFFIGSNYVVELEKELSLKKQYLDVVIIKQITGEPLASKLPSGLEDLVEHNLITYKSLREPLDSWAIEELIGHYVNYRKQMTPALDELIPQEQFKLYGVTTRYPTKLFKTGIPCKEIQQGVFELIWGNRQIRIIVLSIIPKTQENALWQLFSGKAEGFAYGDVYYNWHSHREKAALNQLYELYQVEGVIMPYTMEDFDRDYTENHLHLLPAEIRLKGVSAADRLKDLPAEEKLKGVSAADRLKDLSIEDIQAFLAKMQNKK